MIFSFPAVTEPVDQGDIVRDCPLAYFTEFDSADPGDAEIESGRQRIVVLTQTCDLAQRKVTQVVVAVAVEASKIVASGQLKAADIRGPVRAGRVFGWYFFQRTRRWDYLNGS